MNYFKKSNSSFNSSYGFKKWHVKGFKLGKTPWSCKTPGSLWRRPYNSQFYADGTPKIPGVRKDGTPRMKGIGKGRRY